MIEHYDKCVLLLPMTGADDGTVFKDFSKKNRTITLFNGAVTKTIAGGVYGSAGYFDGDAYLHVSNDDDFNLYPKGTVSLWAYLTSLTTTFFLYYGINGSNEPWSIIYDEASNKLRSTQSYGTVFYSNVLTGLTTGWHHIELVGDGAEYWWFLDGYQVGYRNSGVSFPDQTSDLHIGNIPWVTTTPNYIQDLAIWKGVALHKTNFTPPSRLTGTINNSGAGVPAILDSTGAPFASVVKAIPREGSGIFSTTADSSGRYSLDVPMMEHNVILGSTALDYPQGDLFVGRVVPA